MTKKIYYKQIREKLLIIENIYLSRKNKNFRDDLEKHLSFQEYKIIIYSYSTMGYKILKKRMIEIFNDVNKWETDLKYNIHIKE